MPGYKQEMPPPGGFAPIDVSRKMPKGYVHGMSFLMYSYLLLLPDFSHN